MPPPPPPSKSYLLVVHDDSSSSSSSSDGDGDDDISLKDHDDDDEASKEKKVDNADATAAAVAVKDPTEPARSYKRKKKKKKKRRKKGKKQQQHSDTNSSNAAAAAAKIVHRQVSFGNVSIRSFGRCLSLDAVPGDGGWPLGLSDAVVDDQASAHSVDSYEAQKQERLQERWKEHVGSSSSNDSNDSDSPTTEQQQQQQEPPEGELETRQCDYKRGKKNPLFRMLAEKERMGILLAESSSSNPQNNDASAAATSSSSAQEVNSIISNSNNSPDRRRSLRLRTRSSSFSNNGGEQFNDTYTQPQVHHIRNELEQIRNSRSMEGSTGCSCRKLNVYLLPSGSDGVVGKKAQHRRMNAQKVKEELRKRHLLPPDHNDKKLTREELEQLLHDAVEKEPCCSDLNCVCVRHGIECQADACSCWFTSHQQRNSGSGKNKNNNNNKPNESSALPLSAQEIKRRCGNKYGMYMVEFDKIDAVRSKVLLCQPVTK